MRRVRAVRALATAVARSVLGNRPTISHLFSEDCTQSSYCFHLAIKNKCLTWRQVWLGAIGKEHPQRNGRAVLPAELIFRPSCGLSMRLDPLNLLPDFRPDAGQGIGRLQVHPKFGRCAEKCGQEHRHVRAYATFFSGDIAYSLGRDSNGFGERVTRNFHRLEKFVLENVSGMGPPSCWSSSFVRHCFPH